MTMDARAKLIFEATINLIDASLMSDSFSSRFWRVSGHWRQEY